jgi:hypothetical protein
MAIGYRQMEFFLKWKERREIFHAIMSALWAPWAALLKKVVRQSFVLYQNETNTKGRIPPQAANSG